MKKIFSIFSVVVAVALIGIIANRFISREATKFDTATKIVQQYCSERMAEARRENNQQKLMYYRYYFDNAGKVVIDLGADYIIKNKKSH